MRILLLLKFTYFASTTFSESQYCIVETESGLVRGRSNRTLFENRLYYSFRGIQYAKPPINELRFKVITFFTSKLFLNHLFDSITRLLFVDFCMIRHLKKIFPGMVYSTHLILVKTASNPFPKKMKIISDQKTV